MKLKKENVFLKTDNTRLVVSQKFKPEVSINAENQIVCPDSLN